MGIESDIPFKFTSAINAQSSVSNHKCIAINQEPRKLNSRVDITYSTDM